MVGGLVIHCVGESIRYVSSASASACCGPGYAHLTASPACQRLRVTPEAQIVDSQAEIYNIHGPKLKPATVSLSIVRPPCLGPYVRREAGY